MSMSEESSGIYLNLTTDGVLETVHQEGNILRTHFAFAKFIRSRGWGDSVVNNGSSVGQWCFGLALVVDLWLRHCRINWCFGDVSVFLVEAMMMLEGRRQRGKRMDEGRGE